MSETDIQQQDTEAPDRGLIRREFSGEMTAGDGRTVDVRIVPYGTRITHNDGLGGVAKGVPYQEEWVAGAFAGQERAANRVLLNFEHQTGLQGIVGHGVALVERSDGMYGSFRIHETPDGDKALLLVREKAVTDVSIEAFGRKSVRTADGVIQRVKAHLHGVSLTRRGAYPGAQVLALREPAELLDEAMLPLEPNPELIERCRRLGIRLPQRYQAHPDVTGTPAESGTPEDGTRHTTDGTQSSEEQGHERNTD